MLPVHQRTKMTSIGQSIALPLELWREITSRLPNRDIKSMRLASKQFSNTVELHHEKFRHQVTEIVWDDARLPRGPRTRSGLPGWENKMVSDEETSDNEIEIRRFRGNWELDWPREYSDDDDDEDDEDDEGAGDPANQLRRSTKFKSKDCPVWFKAACAASVEDTFWRQAGDDGIDDEDPDYKTIRKLGSIGPPLSECWEFYRALIRQQDDVLAGKFDEEAFIQGIKQFPALKKVTVTPAAHGVLFAPLYQTPMIRSFPQGFNYPIPRGWPLPGHEQPEEVHSLPWKKLNEVQKKKVSRILHCDSRLPRTGINCTILDDPCEEHDHLVTLLKKPGFRHLDLAFTLAGTWQSFPRDRLYKALSEAGDLEEISLATTGIDAENEHKNLHSITPIPLKSIFPIENWPKLRHFELSRFIVSQSDVISFLSELPETVRSVNLSFLKFVDNENHWCSFLVEMREQIRESRLWSDRRRSVTIGCDQDISLPGRANWIRKEVDEFLYDNGENPFFDPPMDMVRTGYGTEKDALDLNN
ncbi:hypothetical protein N7519_003338 [Penicillium mononematosum]|uniref:uncharacterized protein n=1 Tax=Penicillium mononematosum TaxID=268346 RepID=UPI00254661A9|nr:uncharacterized protein N7519_003338 [Penicillium mononematosum]KAJ6188430.1 hypothetical protein N7519_003338 [Penicillium mononematosum]